jgi:MFS family permease
MIPKRQNPFYFMNHEETPAHYAKRKAREQKELLYRQKQLAKPKPKLYLFYFFLVISMAYIADEVASCINVQFQSNVVTEFFNNVHPDWTYAQCLSSYQTILFLCSFALVFVIVYKPLSDRFGRKPFLIINTFFIGVGFLVIYLSKNLAVYLIGSMILSFFTAHDVQVVYLLEISPENERATVYSVSKAIAILGTMVIPLLRFYFMGDDSSLWRKVFLVPAIFCFVAAAIAIFLARESDAFLLQRISYLNKSDEERRKPTRKERKENGQGGIVRAFFFCMKHKQLRFLLISSMLYLIPCVATTTYQSVMSKTALLSEEDITYALYFYPITNALMTLIAGLISDHKGRKKAAVVMSICAIASYLLFFLATFYGFRPWLIGLLAGLFVGSYWSGSDQTTTVMIGESAPTSLRSSALAVQGVFQVVSNFLGFGIAALVQIWLPDRWLGLLYLLLAIPGMVISLFIMAKYVGETKGIDLEKVSGEEWDKKKEEKQEEGQPAPKAI